MGQRGAERILLSACTTLELGNNTNFQMVTPATFKFDDIANPLEPLDSPRAEERRLSRLATYIQINNACQGGYEVTGRSVTVIGRAGPSSAYKVFYEGRCK